LIDSGRIIYDGAIEDIKEQYGTHRTLVVELCDDEPGFAIEGAELESRVGTTARLRFDRKLVKADQLIRRVTERYCVNDVSIEEPELESIIRRIYVEGYTDPNATLAPEPALPTVPSLPS
jgi:ABC-2 type transport system ATP-binding protein